MAKLDVIVRVTRNSITTQLGHHGERVLRAALAVPHHRRAEIERALDQITYSPEVDRLRYALEDLWNAI